LKPVFYLLAGPNGAGKSTLYRSAVASGLLPTEAEFVNADLHEGAALQHLQQAIPLADLALLYDTSGVGRNGISGPKLVVRWRQGVWVWQVPKHPAWAKKVQPSPPHAPRSL
jgi:predicted ABC-type ATPase